MTKIDEKIRTFTKSNTCMFVANLKDESNSMVEANFWESQAYKYFKSLEVGKIYSFRGGIVK